MLGRDKRLEMCWWLAATLDEMCIDPERDLGDRGDEILVGRASLLSETPNGRQHTRYSDWCSDMMEHSACASQDINASGMLQWEAIHNAYCMCT